MRLCVRELKRPFCQSWLIIADNYTSCKIAAAGRMKNNRCGWRSLDAPIVYEAQQRQRDDSAEHRTTRLAPLPDDFQFRRVKGASRAGA
jgi:hypothetical protein